MPKLRRNPPHKFTVAHSAVTCHGCWQHLEAEFFYLRRPIESWSLCIVRNLANVTRCRTSIGFVSYTPFQCDSRSMPPYHGVRTTHPSPPSRAMSYNHGISPKLICARCSVIVRGVRRSACWSFIAGPFRIGTGTQS